MSSHLLRNSLYALYANHWDLALYPQFPFGYKHFSVLLELAMHSVLMWWTIFSSLLYICIWSYDYNLQITRLDSEFASYKVRAHALLQRKDADLAAAKDNELIRDQEEALKVIVEAFIFWYASLLGFLSCRFCKHIVLTILFSFRRRRKKSHQHLLRGIRHFKI